jgi:O-antigen chain-terminating methyltransferase
MGDPVVSLATRLQRLPLIGRPLALLAGMLAARRTQLRVAEAERQIEALRQPLADIWTVHRQLVADVQAFQLSSHQALGNTEAELRKGLGNTELGLKEDLRAAQNEVVTLVQHATNAQLSSFNGKVQHDMALLRSEWRATLARDSRALERAADALARNISPPSLGTADLSAPSVYVAFENAFRGAWKVKERMQWYMPHIRALYHHKEPRPVLDLGCGRGEFLQELQRNNIPCVGIDLNPAMVDASRAQGLNVSLAEAVSHLRDREPGSLAAISSFHMIEHIPFDQVLHLIEAAKRALMPGGLLILETPNPENLVVGGCTFWYDPTHIRPLPPAMMAFYVQQAGFDPVRTARFFLRTDEPDVATIDVPVWPSVDGPLDYSIMATKPLSMP